MVLYRYNTDLVDNHHSLSGCLRKKNSHTTWSSLKKILWLYFDFYFPGINLFTCSLEDWHIWVAFQCDAFFPAKIHLVLEGSLIVHHVIQRSWQVQKSILQHCNGKQLREGKNKYDLVVVVQPPDTRFSAKVIWGVCRANTHAYFCHFCMAISICRKLSCLMWICVDALQFLCSMQRPFACESLMF